jgi:hypothetical protein
MVGDSYIEAVMLRADERLQSALSRRLGEPVVALGRAGSHLAQKLAVAQWGITEFRPRALVMNLSETDVSNSLAAQAGDHYFDFRNGKCQLLRRDRPPDSAAVRLIKSTGMYRYLFANLKLSVSLQKLRERLQPARDHDAQPSEPADAGAGTHTIDLITDCFIEGVKALGLPKESMIFIAGGDLDFVYGTAPRRTLDIDVLVTRLRRMGYPVIDTDPVFRLDYTAHRIPLSFRPTDDHWNGRAMELIVDELNKAIPESP